MSEHGENDPDTDATWEQAAARLKEGAEFDPKKAFFEEFARHSDAKYLTPEFTAESGWEKLNDLSQEPNTNPVLGRLTEHEFRQFARSCAIGATALSMSIHIDGMKRSNAIRTAVLGEVTDRVGKEHIGEHGVSLDYQTLAIRSYTPPKQPDLYEALKAIMKGNRPGEEE